MRVGREGNTVYWLSQRGGHCDALMWGGQIRERNSAWSPSRTETSAGQELWDIVGVEWRPGAGILGSVVARNYSLLRELEGVILAKYTAED